MYKNTITNAVLSSIDNVRDTVMEADLSVIHAMVDSYEKASFIMENYAGDERDSFSIFQEDAEVKKKSWLAADPDEGVIMKIIKFIPRMLAKLWDFIKSAWKGDVVPAAQNAAQTLNSIPDKIKNLIDKFGDKDESWFDQHKTELGIVGGTAATAAVALIALFNKDKLKSLINKFVQNIANSFNKVKVAIKGRQCLFEVTVGCKVRTNVGFKKISTLVKALPEYFKRLNEIKKANKNFDQLLESIGSVGLNVPDDAYSVVSDKPVEMDLGEICSIMAEIASGMHGLVSNPEYKESKSFDIFADYDAILKEGIAKLDGVKKKDIETKLAEFQASVSSVSKFTQAITVDGNKGVLKQLKDIAEQIRILEKSYEEGGASTEDIVSHAEEDAKSDGDVSDEDIAKYSKDDYYKSETDNGSGDGAAHKYKKGDHVSAEEALKVLQSAGQYAKATVQNGKIVNKGKSQNTLQCGKEIATGANGVKYDKTAGDYVFEYATDDFESVSSSWYSM